jgi:predicted nucleic acid-binding protein
MRAPAGCEEPAQTPDFDEVTLVLSGAVLVEHDGGATEVRAGQAILTRAGELAAGPHAAADVDERARRQERLQRVEATFDPLPFDAAAARAYGRVFAADAAADHRSRRRVVDLMIAATGLAAGLPVYTRNASDLAGLEALVHVVPVPLAGRPRTRDDRGRADG